MSVFAAAACGGGGGDDVGDDTVDPPDAGVDPDSAVGDASLDISWSIVNDGAPAACPAGATTAAINALRTGDTAPYVDLYDCAAGAGIVSNLPAGEYLVWIDLANDEGTILYAQSENATITLDDGEVAIADFLIEGYNGFWDVSWTISGTTCAAVANQNGVSILSTNSSTNDALEDIYDCTAGEAPSQVTTNALVIGPYVVTVALLDQNDNAIGDAPDVVTAIDHGGQYVTIGPVVITLF